MIFEIYTKKHETDESKTFYYDNESNTLKTEDGFVYEYPNINEDTRTPVVAYDKDHPFTKSRKIKLLKIQLGLSCNYTCDYCSQKFVERAPETSKKDLDDFLATDLLALFTPSLFMQAFVFVDTFRVAFSIDSPMFPLKSLF